MVPAENAEREQPPTTPSVNGGHAMWLSLEIVMETEGQTTHYSIQGHPQKGDPLHVVLDPAFDGPPPAAALTSIALELKGTLEDCTIMVTNEPGECVPPRDHHHLKIVDS